MKVGRAAKFWLACWVAAAALAGAGYLHRFHAEVRLEQAMRECERSPSPRKSRVTIQYPGHPPEEVEMERGEETCDPRERLDLDKDVHSVVFEAWAASSKAEERELLGFLVAGALGLFGVLPWGWYFFLSRLRELASAIRGDGAKG